MNDSTPLVWITALIVLFYSAPAATAQDEARRVLVLHSFRGSLPANMDGYKGLVRGFTSAPDLRVEIDVELADVSRFNDANYATKVRILSGEAPAAVPIVDRDQNDAIFDARELARWKIDENQLPAGIRIVNRPHSYWGQYKTEISVVGLVVALQGLLIFVLLQNRASLRRAQAALQRENDANKQAHTNLLSLRAKLASISKERSLGSLATAIAHEVNQPLIAIQNYAQAARQRLESNIGQTTKIRELIEKTELQAVRAGEIIEHVRNLLITDDAELQTVPLDCLIEKTVRTMAPEIENQGCRIDQSVGADLPAVSADELMIQVVLVNLLQNALRSLATLENQADRVITIEGREINDREVQVSVADRGVGVSPEGVDQMFEPLYTSGEDSLGMGLAICRTIVNAHNGDIKYTPHPAGGAIFHFTLQVATASEEQAYSDERANRIRR